MAKPITNPSNIPLNIREQMKEAVLEVAQRTGVVVPGMAEPELDLQNFMALFEKCTRALWTEEIKRIATIKAMTEVRESTDNDVFESDTEAPVTPVQRPR